MMYHKGCLLALAVVAYAGLASGQQRVGTQQAYALCTLDPDTNILNLDFTLDLNNDPTGLMEVYQAQSGLNCPISHNAVTNTYNRQVQIDVNTRNPPSGQSGCNRLYNQITGAYTWYFAYYELPSGKEYDLGLNRLYQVTCTNANTLQLVVQAEIAVSTPNLDQVVTPYVPDVDYYIMVETSPNTGNYRRVTATDVVPTQTLLKLRLVYNYGTFDVNKMSHIAGLRTLVSPNDGFTGVGTQDFFNNQGCPTGQLSPDTAYGFQRVTPAVTGTSVRETAPFPAFKFDVGQSDSTGWVYFMTYIDFCRGTVDSNLYCNDPCDFYTNTGRKRRATAGGDEEATDTKPVVVRVRVVDSSTGAGGHTADKDDTALYGIIGAVIGIAAVLTVALCVMLVVFGRRRRRRREEESEKKVPPQVFVNQ